MRMVMMGRLRGDYGVNVVNLSLTYHTLSHHSHDDQNHNQPRDTKGNLNSTDAKLAPQK